jgi:hypothetical protein
MTTLISRSSIRPEDKPLSVVHDESNPALPYGIYDVHGNLLSRWVSKEEAEKWIAAGEAPAELPQSGISGTGTEPAKKKRVQSKGRKMPRGIPKKKRAPKKAAKKAAVVNKVAKKTTKKKKRKTY